MSTETTQGKLSRGITILPNAIARDGIVPPNERLVLLALASHAGSEDHCRVLRSTLVREVGISRATVTRALRWLSDKGYVIIQHNKSAMGRGSSTYRLNLKVYEDVTVEDDMPEEPEGEAHTEQGSGSEGAGVRLTQSTSEAHTEPTKEEEPFKRTFKESPSSSSSPSVTREDEPLNHEDLFEKWWDTYPKSHDRTTTLAEYKNAYALITAKGVTAFEAHEVLLNAAKGYVRLCKAEQREMRYIKTSANWLREGNWQDKYPAPPKRTTAWQRPVAE